MKNKLKKKFLNADLRKSNADYADNFNLRPSACNLRPSAFKKSFSRLTDFECKVLKATLKIPLGQTRTYQWLAKKIGHPKAARAVGNALNKNPFPLIIPCHRVIKSDGQIGGYAGGKKMKKYLLELERKIAKSINL